MPAEVVRDLGVYFDSEMNVKSHISKTSRACFYRLRCLQAVRNLITAISELSDSTPVYQSKVIGPHAEVDQNGVYSKS